MNSSIYHQRGMAVIAALLVVIAVSIFASKLIKNQSIAADMLITEQQLSQANWVLTGGLDWASMVLYRDAQENTTTRANGLWSQVIVDLPVGPAKNPESILLSGQIQDAQSRFNLLSLASAGRINSDVLKAFEKLVKSLGQDISQARLLAHRIAASQVGNTQAASMPSIIELSGLSSVSGLTTEFINALKPFVAFVPAKMTININTASAEVINAVISNFNIADARNLVSQRQRGLWFINHGDIINRIPDLSDQDAKWLGVRSDWFLVTGEANMPNSLAAVQALMHRADNGHIKTNWVIYG